jgi:hypothetical protein
MGHRLSLNIRVLVLNLGMFFLANFREEKTRREKLILKELDISAYKVLIEQERDE